MLSNHITCIAYLILPCRYLVNLVLTATLLKTMFTLLQEAQVGFTFEFTR